MGSWYLLTIFNFVLFFGKLSLFCEMLMLIWFYAIAFEYLLKRMSIRCLLFQVALNYFVQAAEAGNANAMAFLGKVGCKNAAFKNAVFLYQISMVYACAEFYHPLVSCVLVCPIPQSSFFILLSVFALFFLYNTDNPMRFVFFVGDMNNIYKLKYHKQC